MRDKNVDTVEPVVLTWVLLQFFQQHTAENGLFVGDMGEMVSSDNNSTTKLLERAQCAVRKYGYRGNYSDNEISALVHLYELTSHDIDRISVYLMDDDAVDFCEVVTVAENLSHDNGDIFSQVLTLVALGFNTEVVYSIYDKYDTLDRLDESWLTPEDFFANPDRSRLMRRLGYNVAEIMDINNNVVDLHYFMFALTTLTKTARNDFSNYHDVMSMLDACDDERLFAIFDDCVNDCVTGGLISSLDIKARDNFVSTVESIVDFTTKYPSALTYFSGYCYLMGVCDWNNPISEAIHGEMYHDPESFHHIKTDMRYYLDSVSKSDYALMVEPHKTTVASHFVPVLEQRHLNDQKSRHYGVMSPIITGAVHDIANGDAELFVTILAEIARLDLVKLSELDTLDTLFNIITSEDYHQLPRNWVKLMVDGTRTT